MAKARNLSNLHLQSKMYRIHKQRKKYLSLLRIFRHRMGNTCLIEIALDHRKYNEKNI